VALVLVNSLVPIPASIQGSVPIVTSVLLTLALGAMGLETDIRKLVAKGLRPLLLGAFASLFIALFSLGLVMMTE
jgi:uncharacterized membrane protein YadS